MDTTATAAPSQADAKQEASSAPTPGLTTAAQLNARMAELTSAARAKAAPPTTPAPPAAAAAVPPAGVATEGETAPVDASSTDEVKKEADKKAEKLIPQSVLQKRIGEVAAKRDAAIAESQRVSLENSKLKAALEFALSEADRFRADYEQGKQYDQRDVSLYEMEMEKKAAETFQKLQQEHEAKLAKYAEEQRFTLVVDQHKGKLEVEMERALSQFRHIDREAILAASELRPSVHLVEIARSLDAAFQKRAEAAGFSRQPPPAPPSPVTVRAPGGSAPTGRHPFTAKGIDDYFKDFVASRGQ